MSVEELIRTIFDTPNLAISSELKAKKVGQTTFPVKTKVYHK